MSQSPQTAHTPVDSIREEFVLDTDIGTDVDDLLALSMVFGSPELAIRAITTVYGDVALRARIVAKTYSAAARPQPPIAPGLAETLSGREVWWPGHEGATIADLDAQTYRSDSSAIELLAASPTVVAIGPLTNIAAAMRHPECVTGRVVLMGGEFAGGTIEHNIRCDIDAARALFGSGVPVVAVGLEQTGRVRLGHDELARIEAAGALGELVGNEMKRFWEFAEQDYNVPHDPIAVLTLARPDLFEFTSGTVTVADDGVTTFRAHPDGLHTIVIDMDTDAVASEITRRILAAAGIAAARIHS